jgi:hypothetical protein
MAGTLFANVRIIDGLGAEPFTGHVFVESNRIKSVGRDRPAATVIANDKARHRIPRPIPRKIVSSTAFSHSLDPKMG